MSDIKTLREQRQNAWEQAQVFRDRAAAGEEMSSEDTTAWDRALADVDARGEQIERFERQAKIDTAFAAIDEQTTVLTPEGVRTDEEGVKAAYRSAFDKYVRNGTGALDSEERNLLAQQRAAMGEGTGSIGGYTVPTGFWAKVTETMKFYGGAEAGAFVLNDTTGANLVWPTNDDTSNTGRLVAENVQHTETDITFGQKTLSNYTFSSDIVLASVQLLQDSGVDVESLIAKKLGQRIGRAQNTYFTTGTGSSQPQGYITGSAAGVTAANTNSITYNDIVDLVHSVDPAYRQSGRCQFKFNDSILKAIRKIRDDSGGAGLGRPIWEPSVQVGVATSLLGYGYTVNNDMATSATGAKTVCFGDFDTGFVVRHVSGGRLLRLAERYADYLQVGFLGFDRADSIVQDSGALKLLTQA